MQYLEGGDKYKENLPKLQGYDLRVEPWGDGSKVPATGRFLLVVGEDSGNVLRIRQFDGTGKRTDYDEKRLRPKATIDLLKKHIKGVSLLTPVLPPGTTWDQIRDGIAKLLGFNEDKDVLLDRGREAGLLLNPGEINRLVKEWILGNKLMPESEFKKLKTADLIKWSANQLESNRGLPAR